MFSEFLVCACITLGTTVSGNIQAVMPKAGASLFLPVGSNYVAMSVPMELDGVVTGDLEDIVPLDEEPVDESANEPVKKHREKEVKKPKKKEVKDRVVKSFKIPNGVGKCNSITKHYMPYHLVTNKTSKQYYFLRDADATTDKETGIRLHDGRYCIAVGSYYTSKIGTKINLIMENGSTVKCVLGDQKADRDTIVNHSQAIDGSIVEMIVDYQYFRKTPKQYPDELSGKVLRLDIVE